MENLCNAWMDRLEEVWTEIAKVFPHDELHTDNSEAQLSYI
jgi:hypothetical protein